MDYGDFECCGIIMPVKRGEHADLVCNECGAVIDSVPADQAQQTLLRMAMAGGICTEVCPICGESNIFLGFSSMSAYTCRHCGEGVHVETRVQ
jgi:transcription initiation factor TFIIIB Brf1 subunit/transcription initiation factor TFIIB